MLFGGIVLVAYKHGPLQFSHYFLHIHDVSGTFLGKVHMQWKMRQMYSVIPALESGRGTHS